MGPRVGALVAAAVMTCACRADARGKTCVETGDTVGETTCRRYGSTWAMERVTPFTARFGLRYGELTTSGARFNDNTKESRRPRGYEGYVFRGDALGAPTLSGFGPDGGVTVYLVDQLYVGGETGFLFGSARTNTFVANGYQLRDGGRGIDVMLWHAAIPIGYRVPLGRAHLRAEIAGGGIIGVVFHDITGPGAPASEQSVAARWLLEPRLAAGVWFTQHVSFGAYAGVNLADSGAAALGVSLTFHNRAFDGDWALW
ncbi:MAG: hypothetical protein KIT84_20030 [Labilithrix sp.]|nr:hypothetical protein [Labilithrix sp.]MCW5813328.1 hypothetical protein [Labilithrix sp.]